MVDEQQRWLPQARRAVFEAYRQQAEATWIEAHGGSMRPLIRPGDWMLVEFGTVPPGLGDIVVFSRGELLVAHRVVAQRHQQGTTLLITKGDSEPYNDPLLCYADILGVVRAVRHGPSGPVSNFGCTGRSAHVLGQLSRWSGRGATLVRRAAAHIPGPLQRVALRAIPLVPRVVTPVLLAPMRGVAWLPAIQNFCAGRG